MKTFNAYIIEKLKVTKGSYKTGDELFDFNQKVTSDIQLVAKWEKIKKNNCNGNAIILRYVAILICLSMSIVVIKKHAFR